MRSASTLLPSTPFRLVEPVQTVGDIKLTSELPRSDMELRLGSSPRSAQSRTPSVANGSILVPVTRPL